MQGCTALSRGCSAGRAIRARRLVGIALAAVVVAGAQGGCSRAPKPTQSGFLSDYSRLEPVSESRLRYVSPRLAEYRTFLVEPVQFQAESDGLTEQERRDAAEHMREACVGVIEGEGLALAERPGAGIARVRLAITGVEKSVGWQKIHPAARFAGAGTGGAAMEGEIVDSVSGEQLAAAVQADPGNQFNLTAFSTFADVKGAIDKWAAEAARLIAQSRSGGERPGG